MHGHLNFKFDKMLLTNFWFWFSLRVEPEHIKVALHLWGEQVGGPFNVTPLVMHSLFCKLTCSQHHCVPWRTTEVYCFQCRKLFLALRTCHASTAIVYRLANSAAKRYDVRQWILSGAVDSVTVDTGRKHTVWSVEEKTEGMMQRSVTFWNQQSNRVSESLPSTTSNLPL
jgi:hypothetical protein